MILALKLLLTPFFITLVTLAGRRWGSVVSGLLIGLPLTSGPISIILAVQHGRAFAASAAAGNLCGMASVCLFCLAYSLIAQRSRWPVSLVGSVLVFLGATALWNLLSLSLLPAFGAMVLVTLLVLRCLPRSTTLERAVHSPKWDLPARMIAATLFVYLITSTALWLGPQLSGLLSPFPVFAAVMAVFNHRQQGPSNAARLLHGVVVGSWAYTFFFLMVGGLLPLFNAVGVYLLATLSAIGLNLWFIRRANVQKLI